MRQRVRACVFVVGIVGGVGCIGPRTLVVMPDCGDRMEVRGEAERVSAQSVQLDHSFDPPFTKTVIEVKRKGHTERREVWNNRPDMWHLLIGGGATAAAAALYYGAYVDTVLTGDPVFAHPRPTTTFALGTAFVPFALWGFLTGWHPAHNIHIDDVCADEDADE